MGRLQLLTLKNSDLVCSFIVKHTTHAMSLSDQSGFDEETKPNEIWHPFCSGARFLLYLKNYWLFWCCLCFALSLSYRKTRALTPLLNLTRNTPTHAPFSDTGFSLTAYRPCRSVMPRTDMTGMSWTPTTYYTANWSSYSPMCVLLLWELSVISFTVSLWQIQLSQETLVFIVLIQSNYQVCGLWCCTAKVMLDLMQPSKPDKPTCMLSSN